MKKKTRQWETAPKGIVLGDIMYEKIKETAKALNMTVNEFVEMTVDDYFVARDL